MHPLQLIADQLQVSRTWVIGTTLRLGHVPTEVIRLANELGVHDPTGLFALASFS